MFLDNQATLSIWRNGELLRSVSGMVSSFEQGDSGFRQRSTEWKSIQSYGV